MIATEVYDSWPVGEKRQAVDAAGEKCRLTKELSGTIFRYAPRKSRRGWRYSAEDALKQYTLLESSEDKKVKWKKDVEKVVKKLSDSGLWPELKVKFENLAKVDYDDLEAIKERYNNALWSDKDDVNEHIKVYGADLVNKYPFIFENGIDTFYLWSLSSPKIKPMYFGKWRNASEKEAIKKALQEKRKYITRARTSYDVTFEYDPEKNKAWYMEEYKDCGNGHYYLALDANSAIFYEDD